MFIKEPSLVRRELYRRISLGYDPTYTFESACDHAVLWAAITESEFNAIAAQARAERQHRCDTQAGGPRVGGSDTSSGSARRKALGSTQQRLVKRGAAVRAATVRSRARG